ncbi:hypothetical protein HDU76_005620, partial [Blyttiomyces sp. JEL0837]
RNLTYVAAVLQFGKDWNKEYNNITKTERSEWFWQRVGNTVRSLRANGKIDVIFHVEGSNQDAPVPLQMPQNLNPGKSDPGFEKTISFLEDLEESQLREVEISLLCGVKDKDGELFGEDEKEERLKSLARIIWEHKRKDNPFKFPLMFNGPNLVIVPTPTKANQTDNEPDTSAKSTTTTDTKVNTSTKPQQLKRSKDAAKRAPVTKKPRQDSSKPADSSIMDVIIIADSPVQQTPKSRMTMNDQLMSGTPLFSVKKEPGAQEPLETIPEVDMDGDDELNDPEEKKDINSASDLEIPKPSAKTPEVTHETDDFRRKYIKVLLMCYVDVSEKPLEQAHVDVKVSGDGKVHINDVRTRAEELVKTALTRGYSLISLNRVNSGGIIQFGETTTLAVDGLEYKCALEKQGALEKTVTTTSAKSIMNSRTSQPIEETRGSTVNDLMIRAGAYRKYGRELIDLHVSKRKSKPSENEIWKHMMEQTDGHALGWPKTADMFKYYCAVVDVNKKVRATLGEEFEKDYFKADKLIIHNINRILHPALKRLKFPCFVGNNAMNLPKTFQDYFKFANSFIWPPKSNSGKANNVSQYQQRHWEVDATGPTLSDLKDDGDEAMGEAVYPIIIRKKLCFLIFIYSGAITKIN